MLERLEALLIRQGASTRLAREHVRFVVEAAPYEAPELDRLLADPPPGLAQHLARALLAGPPAGTLGRAAWELLYRAGCPHPRLGLLVEHVFTAEGSDGWHCERVAGDAWRPRARRLIARGFPFRRGPFPDLGAPACRRAARAALRLPVGAAQFDALKRACSPRARDRYFPGAADLDTLAPAVRRFERDARCGALLLDEAKDRYVLPTERRAAPPRPRRSVPQPPPIDDALVVARLALRGRAATEAERADELAHLSVTWPVTWALGFVG